MNAMIRFLCLVIGWKPRILEECGESSRRMLLKLASALLIMVCLWGTIGYVFAGRYINIENEWARLAVAAVFATIIINIERIIILNVSKNTLMSIARWLIAVCMAILGSFIIDQVIFSNDLEEAVFRKRRQKIGQEAEISKDKIQQDISLLKAELESLSNENNRLHNEMAQRPAATVTTRNVRNVIVGTDEKGNPIYERKVDTEQKTFEIKRDGQINSIRENIKKTQERIDSMYADLRNVDDQLRDEYIIKKSDTFKRIGFMEELNASIEVFTQSWITIVFYIILFVFMMCLELMVLTIKNEECDYDLIVIHQLQKKKLMLNSMLSRYKEETMMGTEKTEQDNAE